MGKTTILSCLYYTLSGKIEKLVNVNFKEIIVQFSDEKLVLSKNDLIAYTEKLMTRGRRRVSNLQEMFPEEELRYIKEKFADNHDYMQGDMRQYIRHISDVFEIPLQIAESEFIQFLNSPNLEKRGTAKKALEFKKKIADKIKNEILYFPTYRRIEEDMSKLEIDMERNRNGVKDKLIQFGMSDVDATIKKILAKIVTEAIDGFTQMTGVLLKQYLDDMPETSLVSQAIDQEKLMIALERIGEQIDANDKKRIINFIHGTEENDEKIYLRNLLNQLIRSYEKQNQYDERVKSFVTVCNGYLRNKKYDYNESKVDLKIYHTNYLGDIEDANAINTQNLSSGEKQIISMFSKLYLEEQKPCIILFDEPELSLSIKWQKSFLPDIMNSGRCVNLVAVTHSPFIFDNEFDCYAEDMHFCFSNCTGGDF